MYYKGSNKMCSCILQGEQEWSSRNNELWGGEFLTTNGEIKSEIIKYIPIDFLKEKNHNKS